MTGLELEEYMARIYANYVSCFPNIDIIPALFAKFSGQSTPSPRHVQYEENIISAVKYSMSGDNCLTTGRLCPLLSTNLLE